MTALEPQAASGQDPERIKVLGQCLDVLALIVRGVVSDDTAGSEQVQVINIVHQANGIGSYIASHTKNSTTENSEGEKTVSDTYIAYQAGAFGPSAQAHEVKFQQAIVQNGAQVDITQLERELTILMTELRTQANTPQHFTALAEVASAELAVKGGDGNKAMSHLRKAGKWVLDVATELSCGLVVETIKATLGIH